MNPVLARLLKQRQDQTDFIAHLLEQVEAEQRDLVDAERSNLEAAKQRIKQLDDQIKPLEEFEAVRSAHAETVSQVIPTQPRQQPERLTITERKHEYATVGEFIVDYLRARGQSIKGGTEIAPDTDALARVQSSLGRSLSVDERTVAKQTTTETPGLLPKSIIGQILSDLDASRPFIASVGAKPLGTIPGKTFSRPIITQHTQTGKQTAEKTELVSRQFKVDSIDFVKSTHGGSLNISRQEMDWTSPEAWNAIISDLQLEYGAETEDDAAAQFAAGVTQKVTIAKADEEKLPAWIKALYAAATMAATANKTKRASALRLPDTIWTSIDMWGSLGSMLTANRTLLQQAGKASPVAFAGDILDIPRVMCPGLPAGSMVVGRSGLFEFYEERIGLLSAVEPSILGIEVAYGGYTAAGHLDATAFVKVEVATA